MSRLASAIVLLLWLLCGAAVAQLNLLTGAGGKFRNAAPAAGLALNGTPAVADSNSWTTLTPVLTTSVSNTVVIVLVGGQMGPNTVTSVVGSTLGAFTQRATGNRFSQQRVYAYWKVAASPLTSENITVTASGGGNAGAATAFAISGANTASPFDPNGALPGVVGAGGAGGVYSTITTTNANTFLYGVIYASNILTPTVGAGWTILAAPTNRNTLMEYKIVSSTQSGTQLTGGNVAAGDNDTSIADAVTQ